MPSRWAAGGRRTSCLPPRHCILIGKRGSHVLASCWAEVYHAACHMRCAHGAHFFPGPERVNLSISLLPGRPHHLPGPRGLICARHLCACGPHRPHLHTPGQPRDGGCAAGECSAVPAPVELRPFLRAALAPVVVCESPNDCATSCECAAPPPPSLKLRFCCPFSTKHLTTAEHLHDRPVPGGCHAGTQHRAVGGWVLVGGQQRVCAAEHAAGQAACCAKQSQAPNKQGGFVRWHPTCSQSSPTIAAPCASLMSLAREQAPPTAWPCWPPR